jgi:hypothetical protein
MVHAKRFRSVEMVGQVTSTAENSVWAAWQACSLDQIAT